MVSAVTQSRRLSVRVHDLPSFDYVVEQLDWCNGPARAWGFGALSVSDVGASCALPGSRTRYRASSIDVAQRGATRTLGLQPVSFPKAPVQGRARPENDRDHAKVSVRPFKFRHVFEVHAVDASHRRRDRQDGCPRREATRDVGLLGLPRPSAAPGPSSGWPQTRRPRPREGRRSPPARAGRGPSRPGRAAACSASIAITSACSSLRQTSTSGTTALRKRSRSRRSR